MPIQLDFPGLMLPATVSLPDTTDLRNWPDVPGAVVCRHAKALGAAGEALFDSQMHCFGEIAATVPETFPFDRILLRAPRLLRVQIKTVIMPSGRGYTVEPRKGYRGSPQGTRPYEEHDFDLLAIVILRENVIRYIAGSAPRHHIPLSAIDGLRRNPRASFDAALSDLGADPTPLSAPDPD